MKLICGFFAALTALLTPNAGLAQLAYPEKIHSDSRRFSAGRSP
jgi:hypothetical protein